MLRLVDIASRGMYGEKIAPSDLTEATQHLESNVALERYAATVILLMSRKSESNLSSVIDSLERDCKNTPPEEEEFWLNCAIGYLPDRELLTKPSIRLFIYRSAFSEQIACRSNAMSSLERLAKAGDGIALALLKICSLSEEFKVRTNARSSLRNLEGG